MFRYCLLTPFYLGNYDDGPNGWYPYETFSKYGECEDAISSTLLSVCFCNLKSRNTAKKGTIDYYLTPSLSTTSHTESEFCKYTVIGFV